MDAPVAMTDEGDDPATSPTTAAEAAEAAEAAAAEAAEAADVSVDADAMAEVLPLSGHAGPAVIESAVEQLAVMRETDAAEAEPFAPHAAFVPFWRVLVDWIAQVGETFSIDPIAVHTAVRHLNRVLAAVPLPAECLELVAIACVLIAAKMEEPEDHGAPTISMLLNLSRSNYNARDVHLMELAVLDRIGWRANTVTALHFAGAYLTAALDPDTDTLAGQPVRDASTVLRSIASFVLYFLDLCLQDYHSVAIPAAVLAAGAVVAARTTLHVAPACPAVLLGLCGRDAGAVGAAIAHITRLHAAETASAATAAAAARGEGGGASGEPCTPPRGVDKAVGTTPLAVTDAARPLESR